MRYVDGDLRDIRLGDHGPEIVRRIYMVFQDLNWTARPWVITDEQVDARHDSFDIRISARGTFDAQPFTWQGELQGGADGLITYRVRGEASAPFLRNRLGLCVLHPIRETAGQPAVLEHIDGTIVPTSFPDEIDPGMPFMQMRALSHEVAPGVRATVRMTGDTFESEDHRNWSDASYKHYCTPISLPFPVVVEPGDVIEQEITVTLSGSNSRDTASTSPDEPMTITMSDRGVPMPGLGIQLDTDGHVLSPDEITRLRALHLDHVRVTVTPRHSPADLERMLGQTHAIGAPAVVVLDGADPGAFMSFHGDSRIREWLAFDAQVKVADPRRVRFAEQVLGAVVGGGTNLYFTELNRARPAASDLMAFSVNPQVHAADDQSVMQNAMTQGVIARNARDLYPDSRLMISPITLRPRFNPNATMPELDVSSTPLPSRVDARQCLPFAAAWTALSIKAIAESGCIDAVTYFEATGWEGLLERAGGSPQPQDFASTSGEPFPVYHLLAALAGATTVRPCMSSEPDAVDALIVDGTAFVINATEQAQSVLIAGRTVDLDPYAIVTIPVGGPA